MTSRLWALIGGVGLIVGVVIAINLWIADKNHQIAEARGQRNAAVVFAIHGQADLVMARVNNITLSDAIGRQNAAVQALSAQSARSLQEASQGLARAQRLHATDQQRLAVLGRPLVGATACARADEAAQRAREALR